MVVNYSGSRVKVVVNSIGVINAGVDIGVESSSPLTDFNLSLKVRH